MTKVLTQIQQNGILDGFDGCLRRSWSCFIFHSWLDYSFPRCILDLLWWPSRFGLFLDSGQILSLAVTKKKKPFFHRFMPLSFSCVHVQPHVIVLCREKKKIVSKCQSCYSNPSQNPFPESEHKNAKLFFFLPPPRYVRVICFHSAKYELFFPRHAGS